MATSSDRSSSILRYTLGAVLAFGAMNAFGGGVYGLAGAKGVPTEWLAGSPFRDYFVPSLILFTVVGGALLVGSFAVFARLPWARRATLAAGTIVLGWLVVQVLIIGCASWLQPATALAALLILVLASLLRARVDGAAGRSVR